MPATVLSPLFRPAWFRGPAGPEPVGGSGDAGLQRRSAPLLVGGASGGSSGLGSPAVRTPFPC